MMSRIVHLLNMSLRYGRSKGVQVSRLEEPPLGSLAPPCHLEESDSHHLLNMSLRYGRSKGVRDNRQEEPPLGSLAATPHLTENASHHMSLRFCRSQGVLAYRQE